MNRSINRLTADDQDNLFPEFHSREERDASLAEHNETELPTKARKDPLILSVMSRLAAVLAEETAAVRAGDFEAFNEIQRQKGTLIRQAERLQNNQSALNAVDQIDTEVFKSKLDEFNNTVETNMRTIGAVKDAITHVRHQAIKKLEEEKGDGVYSKDGERKSLHRLSLNETKVKL
ncbi:MAG: hypothetical protein HRU11_06025 [Parvularculaceae bacterium]|nr:hypothetical protein [Parvularculaceae bacterium]